MKSTKKTAYIKKLKYTIISSILEKGKLPETSLSPQALQYHLTNLKLEGIIWKIGKVWMADKDKWEQYNFKESLKKQHYGGRDIRGHGFQWYLKIPSIPGWSKRERKLKEYVESKAVWKGQKIVVRNYKCWLLDKCIIMYLPKGKSFYHYSAEESYSMAVRDLYGTLKGLENRLGISLKIDGKYQVKPSKQHYAKIKDSLAKDFNQRKEKLRVLFEGEEWLIIDDSFNLNELEFVNSSSSKRDADKVGLPFIREMDKAGITTEVFNDLKEYHEKTGESLTMSKMLELIQKTNETTIRQAETINALSLKINELLYKEPEKLSKRDSYFF